MTDEQRKNWGTKKGFERLRIDIKILRLLRGGVKLTHRDAEKWPICTSRLGAYIHLLRCYGNPIVTDTVKYICRDGHTAYIAEYYMVKGKKAIERWVNDNYWKYERYWRH